MCIQKKKKKKVYFSTQPLSQRDRHVIAIEKGNRIVCVFQISVSRY